MKPIDWDALAALRDRPHPNLNHLHPADLPEGVGEVLCEALTVQHLLDQAGVPLGERDSRAIDARVWQAVTALTSLRRRVGRITEAHRKAVDGHGGTWGDCAECGLRWPCPTFVWATTDRDVNATWDPADDDPGQPA